MPYPMSPFNEDFNIDILYKTNDDELNTQIRNSYLKETLNWICTAPNVTSIRVNTLKISVDEFYTKIYKHISEMAVMNNRYLPSITIHPILKEVIIVHNWNVNEMHLQQNKKEVVIDVSCGASVLRGAHIFAPGVLGMLSGVQIGDEVSIYVDVNRKCKKGMCKVLNSKEKLHIGNGIAMMNRHHLFSENHLVKGVAIKVTDTISGCIQTEDFMEKGIAMLHNLPSIVCVHVLNAQINDVVLDMCASPGNKTTNIATYTKNMCKLIALDKTPNKVKILTENCETNQANVHIFQADSTHIFKTDFVNEDVTEGPPFGKNTFDKILLDAPCSALGNRPLLSINSSAKELTSYVPLQRKLFENAVYLLKENGVLVYSTCTITLAENEGIVSWALKRFKNLKLLKAEPYLGENGLIGTDLTEHERGCVQRFGPNSNNRFCWIFYCQVYKKLILANLDNFDPLCLYRGRRHRRII